MATSKNKLGSKRHAFSLLELLAVVTIMAVVASIVVPRIAISAFSAKEKACYQYRGDLNAAIERYIFEQGGIPDDLNDLANTEYYPSDIPACPVEKSVYQMDADTGRIIGHRH